MDKEIRCNVQTCKHNDHSNKCSLGSIEVGKTSSVANTCKDTECESFDCL